MNKKHFEASINLASLRKGSIREIVTKVKIPNRRFPTPIFIQDDNCFCAGYFLSYDMNLTGDLIFSLCKKAGWNQLSNFIADLVILYVDTKVGEINMMTGQTGKFPCFFSIEDDWVYISTSFANVRKSLKHIDINPSEVVDFIVWNQASFTTDNTIFKQIRQLPPATLLSIDCNLKITMIPLINRLSLLKESADPFPNQEDFTLTLLDRIEYVVKRYCQAVSSSTIATELSSGFDSSLVAYVLKNVLTNKLLAYTRYSPFMTEDTNLDTVNKFCQKHGITDCPIDISEFYPFSGISDAKKAKGEYFVTDHGFENHWLVNSLVAKGKETVLFTGHGGDEMYGIHDDTWIRFPIQFNYFSTLGLVNYGVNEILTNKGKDILIDRNRYSVKMYYPSQFSSSVVALGQLYFPIFWETGVWPLMPLADPRISEVVKRIPKSLRIPNKRHKMWGSRLDIFVKEQFVIKRGPDKLVQRFIDERRQLTIDTLKNSVLSELGLVNVEKILNDFANGDTEKYKNGGLPLFLQAVIQLELYLQKKL